jgi:alkylation response protein AidB-like acyl-CoA dehydrogenase
VTDALALPPARLPATSAALRGEVRDWLATQSFTPRCDTWGSAWGGSAKFTNALGARGWIGMTWPKRYGGAERSALERHVVIEELLAAGAPVSAHWVADRQTGPALLRFGTEAQRRRLLPAMARGECRFAIGMSEPDAGSDLAAVQTRAERTDGGWLVHGTKTWTGGAHAAEYFVVLCRSNPHAEDRHAGLTQLIVDLRSPGISMRPINLMHGIHQWNEVSLDGVHVPDEMVLGEVGAGWAQVTAELAYERSGPERILSTYPLLETFAETVAPDDDPRVLAALGSLVAELQALRSLSARVATALDDGAAPNVAAALVKDLGTRFEGRVVERIRLTRRVDTEQALFSTPAFTLRGGTTEILRTIVARALSGEEPPAPAPPTTADGPAAIAEAAGAVLDLALAHTRTRHQFGRPLARFQAVQQHLAVLAGHAMSARAAADLADRDLAAAHCGEVAGEIARIGHQLHGALGYTDEHPLHHYTRALWRARDAGGTEEDAAIRAGTRLAGPGLWERLNPR